MVISPKITKVSTQQERIAKIAEQTEGSAIKSLNQYLTAKWLQTACEFRMDSGQPEVAITQYGKSANKRC